MFVQNIRRARFGRTSNMGQYMAKTDFWANLAIPKILVFIVKGKYSYPANLLVLPSMNLNIAILPLTPFFGGSRVLTQDFCTKLDPLSDVLASVIYDLNLRFFKSPTLLKTASLGGVRFDAPEYHPTGRDLLPRICSFFKMLKSVLSWIEWTDCRYRHRRRAGFLWRRFLFRAKMYNV